MGESMNKKVEFFDIAGIKLSLRSNANHNTIMADMNQVFSDEVLAEIPLRSCNDDWMKIEIVITKHRIVFNTYRVVNEITLGTPTTISTNWNFRMSELIGDDIKTHHHNYLFSFHSVRFDINDNKRNSNKLFPAKDLYSYSYPETLRLTEAEIKKGDAYWRMNNRSE